MTRPISHQQWLELREWYEDDDEEPGDIDESAELEDFASSIEASDDHDRRFSDQYDTANGDNEGWIDPPW